MTWDGQDRRGSDELMMTIGELKAEAKSSQRQRAELFSQVGEVREDIAKMNTTVTECTSHIAAMLDKHDVKIKAFDEDITTLKKFKQRMLLGIAGIAGSGGITGAVLTKLGLN